MCLSWMPAHSNTQPSFQTSETRDFILMILMPSPPKPATSLGIFSGALKRKVRKDQAAQPYTWCPPIQGSSRDPSSCEHTLRRMDPPLSATSCYPKRASKPFLPLTSRLWCHKLGQTHPYPTYRSIPIIGDICMKSVCVRGVKQPRPSSAKM